MIRVSLHDVAEKYRVKLVRGNQVIWKEHWALKGVDLELRDKEVLGIIGKNGAGKSTLLKVIAGIFAPDRGTRTVNGRISYLFDLGAGLSGELTGRENIIHNLRSYGISTHDVEEKIAEIIDFSMIGEFIDAPLKYYSSGMYARLAFSLALSVDPDILLVDDILSVGDTFFQAKSLKRLAELKKEGCSLVLVSHDLEVIRRLCDQVVVIEDGKIVAEGPPEQAITFYLHGSPAVNKTTEHASLGFSFSLALSGKPASLQSSFYLKTFLSEKMLESILTCEAGQSRLYFPSALLSFIFQSHADDHRVCFSLVSEQRITSMHKITCTTVFDIPFLGITALIAGEDTMRVSGIQDAPVRFSEHILDEVCLRLAQGIIVVAVKNSFYSAFIRKGQLHISVTVMQDVLAADAEFLKAEVRYDPAYTPPALLLPEQAVGNSVRVVGKGRRVDVYHNQEKITSGLGLYLSLKKEGVWYDSRQAFLKEVLPEQKRITFVREWSLFNIVQKESYTLEDDHIAVVVSVNARDFLDGCSLFHYGIMCSSEYQRFSFADIISGNFIDAFSNTYEYSAYVYMNLPYTKKLSLFSPRLPTLSIVNRSEAFNCVVENSDEMYRSRLVKAERMLPEGIFSEATILLDIYIQ